MTTGEENSGFRFNKFPYLPDHDGLFRSQSTPEMRLSEMYYSLAECYYREGNKAKAAELLDYVRVRNYPAEEWSKYSYVANLDKLTDSEFLDATDKEYSYFPIPQNQLNASPILKQTTPGWE